MGVENGLLIPSATQVQAIVAEHNVPEALEAADEQLLRLINSIYSPRAGDHLMLSGLPLYTLVPDANSEVLTQMRYRAGLIGHDIGVITDLAQLPEDIHHFAYVPFVPSKELDTDRVVSTLGLPTEVTRKLINKVTFHRHMLESGLGMHVPEYVEAKGENLEGVMGHMAYKIDQMYQDCELKDYPMGLMIRGAEADGQFGSAVVVELTQGEAVGGVWREAGSVLFVPNGERDKAVACDDWDGAIVLASEHLRGNTELEVDDRFVVSRLIDIESPGVSQVVSSGDRYSLEMNSQYTTPGSQACKGTMTMSVEDKLKYQPHQDRIGDLLEDMWKSLGDEVRADSVYAMFNHDLMIVGENSKERVLWERINQDEGLWERYGSSVSTGYKSEEGIGNYQPRVCDPEVVLVAECNPRLTNWLLSLVAVMGVRGMEPTVANILALGSGSMGKIASIDAWKMPEGVGNDTLRVVTSNPSTELAQVGGVILRMPGDEPGMIFYTNNGASADDAHELIVQQAIWESNAR